MNLLIVDDDALIRDSLDIIFSCEEDICVTGTAKNGLEALIWCARHPETHIVLMDIRMPEMDGVEATEKIKKEFPEIRVILLTTFQDDDYIRDALKAGADGYILKTQNEASIIEAVRAAGKGARVFGDDIARKLVSMLPDQKKRDPEEWELTPRDLEFMKLLAEGLSNKEMADDLCLSEGTVKNYLSGLLLKLELRDRTQLALFYVRHFES